MRAAEHLERRELHDRGLQPRLIDDDGGGVALEHGAREHDRERLAHANGAGARPPPALQRVGLDVLSPCGRDERGEQSKRERNASNHVFSHLCATFSPVPYFFAVFVYFVVLPRLLSSTVFRQ